MLLENGLAGPLVGAFVGALIGVIAEMLDKRKRRSHERCERIQ
jgi:hypothetical protein